ncbi:MAG: hypothetical protein AAB388_01030 [Patescibacteria group bacterium]
MTTPAQALTILLQTFQKRLVDCFGWHELCPKTQKLILEAGLYFLGELLIRSKTQVLEIPGLGKVKLKQIERLVRQNGGELGMKFPNYATFQEHQRLRREWDDALSAPRDFTPALRKKFFSVGIVTVGDLASGYTTMRVWNPIGASLSPKERSMVLIFLKRFGIEKHQQTLPPPFDKKPNT